MRARQRVRSLLLIVFLLATLTTGSALAHPPDGTDHGVEPSVFRKLWSKDEGGKPDGNTTTEVIAASSDFSFLTPPEAPEDWNDGEFDEFGGQFDDNAGVEQRTYSIYPEDTNLTDADWIKDAYAEIFAVQPSTVVHLSPETSKLYVPTKGKLYSVVDFRVDLPEPDNPVCPRPVWELSSYNIESVKLLANGRLLKKGDLSATSQASVINYNSLPRNANRLTFQAKINVRAKKKVKNRAGRCTWDPRPRLRQHVVNDTIRVETYRLSGIARMARYPDGSSGIFAYQNSPWHGFSLPGGNRVYSNWRFFTARDTDWDDLTVSSTTPGGSKTSPARLHTH
ncbi:MAG: hypothetical protein SV760_10115, partial [Halobacteria archaeon]|nr:hypothetical protein [Halobacteria archaeon]